MQIEQFDKYASNPHNIKEVSLLCDQIHCGITKDVAPRVRTNKDENCMILSYTLTGTNYLYADNKTYIIKENTFSFRHPKLTYKLNFGACEDNRRCFLKLPSEFFNLLEKVFPDISKLPIVFTPTEDYDVLSEFFTLINCIGNTDEIRIYECFPQIFNFIFTVLKLSPTYNKNTIIKNIHEVLSQDFSTPLEEIVENFGINYNTFRKDFVKIYGLSPSKYRNSQRIFKAKALLHSGLTCGEVSQKLSYADIYTFSHQFKKSTGLTPRAYIKSLK